MVITKTVSEKLVSEKKPLVESFEKVDHNGSVYWAKLLAAVAVNDGRGLLLYEVT